MIWSISSQANRKLRVRGLASFSRRTLTVFATSSMLITTRSMAAVDLKACRIFFELILHRKILSSVTRCEEKKLAPTVTTQNED